jgi:hypothetical protein
MTTIAVHGPANKAIKLTVAFGTRSLSAIRWPSKATASNPIKRMLFVWVGY